MAVQRVKSDQEYKQSHKDSDVYSDFTTAFLPHPFNGQLTRVTDVDSVRQSLRNLILTNKYERLKNPDYGCNIRRHLFDQFSPLTISRIKEDIEHAIKRHEPRVRVEDVDITATEDQNALNVSITFYVVTAKEMQELTLTLYRVR